MGALLLAGMLAGLAGGVVLGILLTVVMPTSSGLPMEPLMQLLVAAVGAPGALVGWGIVIGTSMVVGIVFALLVRGPNVATVASTALALGVGLWLADALIGVPLLLGTSPLAAFTDPVLWPVTPFMLGASLVFTSVVAAVFLGLASRRAGARASAARDLQRAA
jgi:hypothetical protein